MIISGNNRHLRAAVLLPLGVSFRREINETDHHRAASELLVIINDADDVLDSCANLRDNYLWYLPN